jgi:hypothetical protein
MKVMEKTQEQKITKSMWHPDKKLLITHLSGDVDKSDIILWEKSLNRTLDQIEPNETFKIFVNLHGFKAINIDAHKRFRSIVPSTLAKYGWKVGYVDLFKDDAKKLSLTHTRGIRCVAAAHCHQDEGKIALYESRYGKDNERYFIDPSKAAEWIEER